MWPRWICRECDSSKCHYWLMWVECNWWNNSKNRKCEMKRECQVRALDSTLNIRTPHTEHQFRARWCWRSAQIFDGIQLIVSHFFFVVVVVTSLEGIDNKHKRTATAKKNRVRLFSSHPFIVACEPLYPFSFNCIRSNPKWFLSK